MEETKEILRIEYGRDVMGIIASFLYPTCHRCKKMEEEEDMIELWNGLFVCIDCSMNFTYKKCSKCEMMYNFDTNIFCRSCLNSCRVYCSNCIDEDNKKPLNLTHFLDGILGILTDISDI